MAVVLLVGAGLMMKSLYRLLQANIGFNPDNVLTMNVGLARELFRSFSNDQFFQQMKERVGSLPGVAGVGTIDILPLQGGNTTRFYVEAILLQRQTGD